MDPLLAQVEAVFLFSVVKPLLFGAALIGWGYLAGVCDNDAGYFHLPRQMWNLAQFGAAIVGFGLMLVIPIFWVGFPVGLIPPIGALAGYVMYRNRQVPEKERWRFTKEMLTGRLQARQQERAQRTASVRLMTSKEDVLQVPRGEAPYAEAHQNLESLLDFALPRGADRVEIAAGRDKVAIAVRIDGVRYPRQEEITSAQALEVIDYLKEAADLDVNDRRKRQSGELLMDSEDHGRHTLELQTAGSTRGQQMMIEIDPSELANIHFDKLGLLDSQKKQLREVMQRESGVVLTTGPAKQGITTLTYSLVQEHDPYISSVVTVEHEIAFEAEGIKHHQMAEGYTEQQFYSKLAGLLRGDPNVVMLSHLPDEQTGRLVAKSADDVRFYIPFREADTFTAMRRWLTTVGQPKPAAGALVAVVAGRLVRKLCETCKQPYTPDPAALKRLNLPADKISQLYQASGEVVYKDKPQTCPQCMGLGYRGRTGVYEVMPIDEQAQRYIASSEFDRLRSHLRKQKVLWLQEAALNKVVQGITDIKEVTRVMGDAGGRSRKSSSSSPSRSRSDGDGSERQTVKEQTGS